MRESMECKGHKNIRSLEGGNLVAHSFSMSGIVNDDGFQNFL